VLGIEDLPSFRTIERILQRHHLTHPRVKAEDPSTPREYPQPSVQDPDGDEVTAALIAAPPGLSLDAENSRLMEIILKETDRLNRLIGNFLTYARPVPLERRPVVLDELLEETAMLLENSRHRPPGVRIETDCEPGLAVQADPTALRQVLWNLAVNGLEAMPEQGCLTLRARRASASEGPEGNGGGALCRISVSDTGSGIDAETRKKLFFPFHTTKPQGSGLGLAIVHQVVRQSGGWIDVTSEPGRGSTFDVYLPAAAPAAAGREA